MYLPRPCYPGSMGSLNPKQPFTSHLDGEEGSSDVSQRARPSYGPKACDDHLLFRGERMLCVIVDKKITEKFVSI